MLVDKVRVDFYAGSGGNGVIDFSVTGKPMGGNGGDGGSVWLEGTTNLYDLTYFSSEKKFDADNGEHGGKHRRTGSAAEDLVIKVPLATHLYDLESNIIVSITENGQRECIAQGGRGGLGNHYFRRGQLQTLRKTTPGKKGEFVKGFLQLELRADVVFIGLPNAGKSSMLNHLSNATVKVAPYPFTTLEPHLAVAGELVLMDLPGLIEGTTHGKGLGTNFTRHTKSCNLVAHFVSLESDNPEEEYQLIRDELKEIDEEFYNKPELIILTKKDTTDEATLKDRVKKFEKLGKVVTVSIYDRDSLKSLYQEFKDLVRNSK